jgi:hypothetical protein
MIIFSYDCRVGGSEAISLDEVRCWHEGAGTWGPTSSPSPDCSVLSTSTERATAWGGHYCYLLIDCHFGGVHDWDETKGGAVRFEWLNGDSDWIAFIVRCSFVDITFRHGAGLYFNYGRALHLFGFTGSQCDRH